MTNGKRTLPDKARLGTSSERDMSGPQGEAGLSNGSSGLLSGILKRFAQVIIVSMVQAAVLFGVAGTFIWIWAWVYFCISFLSLLVNSIFLLRKNPQLVAERGKAKLARTWDKIIGSLYAVSSFLAVPVVAALDMRFAWSGQLPIGWHVGGAVVLALALALAGWAMIENAFFSTAVRIQTDRGHTVCRSGPYRFVRHPGYVGFILQSLAIPLILGSTWAFVPGAVAAIALVLRTSFEDRALQAELPGYREYAQEVRYRLLRGIW